MINGFDKDAFLRWLKEKFPGVIDTHWNYGLVENIIDYALEQKNAGDDELPIFLSSVLPGIEYTEIAKFCKEDLLSDYTKKFLEQLK